MSAPQTKSWQRARRIVVGVAICLTAIGMFYTEENLRGKRAWEECKRTVEAQGVRVDWNSYLPAPVPDEENVFGVPEIQRWFNGRGSRDLSDDLSHLNDDTKQRVTIAKLTVVLPEDKIAPEDGAHVLHLEDPSAQVKAGQLSKEALGPVIFSTQDIPHMLRAHDQIRPQRIILLCQTAPTTNELLKFLSTPIPPPAYPSSYDQKMEILAVGGANYDVSIAAPETSAEYLRQSEIFTARFDLIREALKRPYVRINGDYSDTITIPIPNFVVLRATVQTLSTMAQCHLLEGEPEASLREVNLINELCRIPRESRPPTLLGSMLNVAIEGLFVNTVSDGLQMHAWGEPQLAALEEALQKIRVLPPIRESLGWAQIGPCGFLERRTLTEAMRIVKSDSAESVPPAWEIYLAPRGWVYQNMATILRLRELSVAGFDSDAETIRPAEVESAHAKMQEALAHFRPDNFIAVMSTPNFTSAYQTAGRVQTTVNQTLIACALERSRLARGQYPDSLQALVPKYLTAVPGGAIGGAAPHYSLNSDGTFTLYSVGWSGRDEGGRRRKDKSEGDWFWPQEH